MVRLGARLAINTESGLNFSCALACGAALAAAGHGAAVRHLTGRFRSLYGSSDADLDQRLASLDHR